MRSATAARAPRASRSRAERDAASPASAAPRAWREAALIYTADKVAKTRELRGQAAGEPARFGPRSQDPSTAARARHYEASLAMLEQALPGEPLVRQLRFELEVYRHLSPQR